MWWLRHTLAVLVLPLTVTVLIPVWIARSRSEPPALPHSPVGWVLSALGAPVLLAGLGLFVACVTRFGQKGRGTLAPWDPPRKLVTDGAYAHSRNPMISGVILILVAEAMLLRSLPQLEWAGLFALINAVYIPLLEEPMLRARFGTRYEEYARNVPRLIPRLRPYLAERPAVSTNAPGDESVRRREVRETNE